MRGTFLKTAFDPKHVEINLAFIAKAISNAKNMTPDEIMRHYFLYDFFPDHCKVYQKRPIYWLYDSERDSKKKCDTLKCLTYLHRYNRDTAIVVRRQYIDAHLNQLKNSIDDLEKMSQRTARDEKELKMLKAQEEILTKYELAVREYADSRLELNLDDGVKANYEKFAKVLPKI